MFSFFAYKYRVVIDVRSLFSIMASRLNVIAHTRLLAAILVIVGSMIPVGHWLRLTCGQTKGEVRQHISVNNMKAGVMNHTIDGAFFGARMVIFEGQELLMLAPRNDEYVGGHILRTGEPFEKVVLRRRWTCRGLNSLFF